ncbi:hypothetical protein LWI28_000586 [Acer negundo]|uniref:Uncharacterized protein n=1 Tax=Acer negundo TaxID=4023 RepID=A0AAD5JR22_ACENE|nr:hypothetical protein LWI28_000586 [Acer negundo]
MKSLMNGLPITNEALRWRSRRSFVVDSGRVWFQDGASLLIHKTKTRAYNMENSSEEETYFSISEFTEYTEKSYEDPKASKYKVNVNDRLRCPFCPGKNKHDYKLEHLL